MQLPALWLAEGGWLPVGDAASLGVGLKPFTILYEPVPALLELLRTTILCKALRVSGLFSFAQLLVNSSAFLKQSRDTLTSSCSNKFPHPQAATSIPVSLVVGSGIKYNYNGIKYDL